VSLKKLVKLEPLKNGKFVGLTNAIGEKAERIGGEREGDFTNNFNIF